MYTYIYILYYNKSQSQGSFVPITASKYSLTIVLVYIYTFIALFTIETARSSIGGLSTTMQLISHHDYIYTIALSKQGSFAT